MTSAGGTFGPAPEIVVPAGNGYVSDFQGPYATQNDMPNYDDSKSFLKPQDCTYTCCKA